MKLLKSLFVATMFAAGAFSAAAQSVEKFYFGVTGYGEANMGAPATIDMTVFDNFSFKVMMPIEGEDNVRLDKATMSMRMNNVGTLGVSGLHTYSKLIETGMGSTTVPLHGHLSHLYNFDGATANITLTDGTETKTFAYRFGGALEKRVTLSDGTTATRNVIEAKTKEDMARADWHLLTKYVTTYSESSNTQLVLKQGGYVQMGNEVLTFNKDVTFFGTPDWTLHSTRLAFYDATSVSKIDGISAADSYVMTIYFPKGTTLQVGGRVATLDVNTTITIDASEALTWSDRSGVLSANLTGLRNYMGRTDSGFNKQTCVENLIDLFDNVVSIVDDADNVKINVNFQPELPPVEFDYGKFYFGVTGYGEANKQNPATVDMTVYENFNFNVTMPVVGEDKVRLDNAKIEMRMNNVGTLGVEGESVSIKDVTTGMGSATASLSGYLDKAYNFEGAYSNITLTDGKESKSFGYKFNAATDKEVAQPDGTMATKTVIEATTKEPMAREDWHFLTQYVYTYDDEPNTRLLLKEGGYIQMGNERMDITNDLSLFEGSDWSTSSTREDIYNGTTVTKITGISAEESYVMTMFFPEGTTLQVGGRVATLLADTKITIDASQALLWSDRSGVLTANLTGLRDYMRPGNTSFSKQTYVENFIDLFNNIIGIVDDAESVSVKVEFTPLINGDMDHDGDIEADDVATLADMILGKAEPEVIGETTNGDLYEGEVVNPLSIGDLCRQIDTALGNREKVYIKK